jgi:hypothetical protein
MRGPQQGLEAQAALQRQERGAAIVAAIKTLRDAMHMAEGTIDPGEHQEHVWNSRPMAMAAEHLELVEFYALKAVL